jgi:predicted nuclease with TOPRIM domain
MDPNTKLLLDEMKRLGERFTSLETRIDSLGDRFKAIEHKAEEVTTWKTDINSSVTDLVAKVYAADNFASKVNAVDDLVRKAGEVDSLKAQM